MRIKFMNNGLIVYLANFYHIQVTPIGIDQCFCRWLIPTPRRFISNYGGVMTTILSLRSIKRLKRLVIHE